MSNDFGEPDLQIFLYVEIALFVYFIFENTSICEFSLNPKVVSSKASHLATK